MQVIFCQINEFDTLNTISVLNEDTGDCTVVDKVSDDNVGHTIVTYANNNQINRVIFGGASDTYLDRFVDDVYTIHSLMYSNNDIEVYKIGEQ